jgi:hypothetical protein
MLYDGFSFRRDQSLMLSLVASRRVLADVPYFVDKNTNYCST